MGTGFIVFRDNCTRRELSEILMEFCFFFFPLRYVKGVSLIASSEIRLVLFGMQCVPGVR